MTRYFQIVFGQQVVTSMSVTAVVQGGRHAACGTRRRLRLFRFLPGLLLVVEFVAREQLSPH